MIYLRKLVSSGTDRSQLVKKNIIGAFAVKGLSVLITFLLVPMSIDFVSSEVYGVWLALSSIVTWIGLFDVGFGNGLRNKIAECMAINDIERAQRYVSTTYACMVMIFMPLGLLLYFICPLIDWCSLLNVIPTLSEEIKNTVQMTLLFFCITFIIKIQNTVLLGLQLNALASLSDTLGNLIVLTTIFTLKHFVNGSLQILALIIYICPIAVYLIIAIWMYVIKYPKLRPTIRGFNRNYVRDIVSLGVKFFIIQIACLVLYSTINVLISNVSGPGYVTEYNVVYKYMSIPLMIFTIIVVPLWSAFTDAYTRNDYLWMNTILSKYKKIMYCMILFTLLLIALYPIFFKIWLGDKVEIHLSMILVVAFYIITTIWNTLYSHIINGIGKIKLQLYCSLLGTFLNIPLALLLGQNFGAIGIISSVIIFNSLPLVLLPIQVKKILTKRAIGIWNK